MMRAETKGKIFLAEERGLNETEWFRSLNMFNFGKYNNEHKQPLGDLYLLNDDMLAGGRSVRMLVEEDSYVVLLPISGAILFRMKDHNSSLVAAGQILVHLINAGKTIEIANPFKNDTVNFLQIWIKGNAKEKFSTGAVTYENVNRKMNELVKVFPGSAFAETLSFSVSIGKFSGRGETIYDPAAGSCFLFVLDGAFEAEGRLLHERDGLALWDANEIEMEALSNDALILLIETHLK